MPGGRGRGASADLATLLPTGTDGGFRVSAIASGPAPAPPRGLMGSQHGGPRNLEKEPPKLHTLLPLATRSCRLHFLPRGGQGPQA